nr:DUF2627 family protein [Bacilli bacterium]
MRTIISWAILISFFLIAGEGINLIRLGIMNSLGKMPNQGWQIILGILLAGLGTSFLGGFIYHRAKRRGQIKKPDWMKK